MVDSDDGRSSRRRRRRRGVGEEESVLSKWRASSSFVTGIFTLVDVDTDLRLGAFVHDDVFTRWELLVARVGRHYVEQLTSSFVSILHLIGGSVSRGVASLAMDADYLRDRQVARRTERISHVGNGLWYGTKRLGVGILQGVTGVFTQPVKGAMRGGASGFVKGVGRGLVGAAVKPVVGVTDFLSSTTAGATATSTAISEFAANGRTRRRGAAQRTRTPRLMYGTTRLLKVYSEDEAFVRAIILAVGSTTTTKRSMPSSRLEESSGKRSGKSSGKSGSTTMTFPPQELKLDEYVTHVRLDEQRVCVITSTWLTMWSTSRWWKQYASQKAGGGKRIDLLFAVRMNSIGLVGTSEDGQDVLISLGVARSATTMVMEVGSTEKAATILQRLTHIVASSRHF